MQRFKNVQRYWILISIILTNLNIPPPLFLTNNSFHSLYIDIYIFLIPVLTLWHMVPCLFLVLPAGILSVKLSRGVCSCDHRSPTPPGRCSTGATGAETDPHQTVCAARRMSDGCSQTVHKGLVDCLRHRCVCHQSYFLHAKVKLYTYLFCFCGSKIKLSTSTSKQTKLKLIKDTFSVTFYGTVSLVVCLFVLSQTVEYIYFCLLIVIF